MKRKKALKGLVSTTGIVEKLKISKRTLSEMIRQGLPVAARGKGRALSWFRLVEVEQWIGKRRLAASDDADFLDETKTSQFLEKWREERWRDARRRNDIAEGRVLRFEEAMGSIKPIFNALRAEFEALGRVHGPAVAGAIGEAIDRAVEALGVRFPIPDPPAPARNATAQDPPTPVLEAKREEVPQPMAAALPLEPTRESDSGAANSGGPKE